VDFECAPRRDWLKIRAKPLQHAGPARASADDRDSQSGRHAFITWESDNPVKRAHPLDGAALSWSRLT
jgi:hypothetical protein